ncbi:MAG: BatA domain-containing protein, partial [Myxococcales bacterium]|nr:BatA domain-containing protein [Myxococcales bacterium]
MSLSFANALLLGGLVGIAVPILIHLYDRRCARPMRFAAIEFVLRSQPHLHRLARPKDWILMALRAAAIAALALAAARPSWVQGAATAAEAAPQRALVIVDDSPAAAAIVGGDPVWDTELDRAEAITSRAGAADAVTVARLSEVGSEDALDLDQASVLDARRRVRALRGEVPVNRALDGFGALAHALRLARAGGEGATRVHVVSRFAA